MSRLAERTIVTRLVLAVTAAMSVVLLVSGAVVWWRVSFALDRQVDRDLTAYSDVVAGDVRLGHAPPTGTPGLVHQVYDVDGRLISGDAGHRLLRRSEVRAAAVGEEVRREIGSLLPPSDRAQRVRGLRVDTPVGTRVLAVAADRRGHDEALRELLLQLLLAGLAVLAAASYAAYRTAHGALRPVERYRAAAEAADPDQQVALPVPRRRDDEVTRLGHTLNHLLARIASAHEQQRAFLADAAHELRSPLTVMKTDLEWVRGHADDPVEVEESLASLAIQVDRLVELSDLLLDLEEVRAAPAPHEDADVAEVARRVVDRLAPQAHRADRELGLRVHGPARARCDPLRLELALGNLVTNALTHGEGDVTVTVTGHAADVLLEVHDEGPGFPPEFVDRAFDRFARADESRSTRGSGLGLALVRAVADLHGGQASASGSTVRLTVPR
ncbi:sensor histidine kinase [Nocardioides marmoribigeumensis]|uniref:histidine kinase n=1 Tax=Nocardioides marmoribigeumensis TaxID=433649 RepID=A0ABU2BYH7_9ACTN|nr:HAMP domain-containing sensor histidine kinase [Nocardioides marmoribigeumensis]MDR7363454.1 signal transduction histidine kinase [Nocardioides marmoribigeumensis]